MIFFIIFVTILILFCIIYLMYIQYNEDKQVTYLNGKLDGKLPNILYLIIYNENNEYERKMKKVLEKYVHKFNHITTYFVTLKQLNKPFIIEGDVIYINGTESFIPGILYKTVKTLQILTTNKEYDYILRGNISTVINLHKLTNILKLNNTRNIYGGGWIGVTFPMHWSDLSDIKFIGTKFSIGTSIIFDKISLKFILDNINKLNYDIIDDVSFGILMKDNKNVSYIEYPGYKTNWSDDYKHIVFYRNKSNNRHNDTNKMSKFVDYLNKIHQ